MSRTNPVRIGNQQILDQRWEEFADYVDKHPSVLPDIITRTVNASGDASIKLEGWELDLLAQYAGVAVMEAFHRAGQKEDDLSEGGAE